MYTLVTGGLRSGRSNYALRRASELGPPPWLYITAGDEPDEAVHKLINRQRKDNEAIWRPAALPADVRQLFVPNGLDGVGALVLDDFLPWLARRIKAGSSEAALLAEVGELADCMYRSRVPVVAVSTEITLPWAPADPDEQHLLKMAASANQILASLAGSVVLMVSGVPLRVR